MTQATYAHTCIHAGSIMRAQAHTHAHMHAYIHTGRQTDRHTYIWDHTYLHASRMCFVLAVSLFVFIDCFVFVECVCPRGPARVHPSICTDAMHTVYRTLQTRCNICEAKSPSSITDDASGSVCLFVIACTAVGADVILTTLVVPTIHQSNYVIQSSALGTRNPPAFTIVPRSRCMVGLCVVCCKVAVHQCSCPCECQWQVFFMAASTGSYFCCIRLISPVTVMATYRTRVLFRYVLMSNGCVQHSRSCACG